MAIESTTRLVTTLKGVGPRVAQRLARIGIETVVDLLFHLPFRYEDRTRVVPIGSLRPGDQVVVEGEIELAEIAFGRRRALLVRLSDGTGALTLRFFHFNRYQQQALQRGNMVRCFGEVRSGPVTLEMVHPEYQPIVKGEESANETSLTPIYPTTEGLHQLSLRKLTDQALAQIAANPPAELLPEDFISQLGLSDLVAALRMVHRPPADADVAALLARTHPAQRRLAFEELVSHQVSLRRLRNQMGAEAAPRLSPEQKLSGQFRHLLPFPLTAAQERVVAEIERDLNRPTPMQRLLQGDVGSGKTVVAALAALQAVAAGYQVAVMAPTELLAEQHHHNFSNWLAGLGLPVAWLSGRLKGANRRVELERIAGQSVTVVVGTHALFQEEVSFAHLGLVVVDEQHRFGVHQRLTLREKGRKQGLYPHQLIMTATPIPRTLAMTIYADLDCSIIDQLPPGRIPVTTVALPDSRREEVISRVRSAVAAGAQAYWICSLVEESEALQCQAAEATYTQLDQQLSGIGVGLVHGQMKSAQKEAVMASFRAGQIDLLVATTVIEVGVDVPNASLMVIENAERFGLSQLHQLRGRIGRGAQESHCVMIYRGPLGEAAQERLAVMRQTNDGFEVARRDLELRGPGEVLGTRQSGVMQLRIADLLRDQDLVVPVQQCADRLLSHYPDRVEPLIRRWLGGAEAYGAV